MESVVMLPHERKASVLFFAYHFTPSNEIGARRPAALARELVSRGYEVLIVSAFEGASPGQFEAMQNQGLIPIRVAEPPKLLLSGLVCCKQWLNKLLGGDSRPGRGGQGDPVFGPDSLPGVGARPNLLVRIATLVDTKKLWAVHAAKAAQSAIATRQPTAIYCTAPPNSALLAALWTATRNRVPLLVDLRDAWMIGSLYDPPLSGTTAWLYRSLERAVFRRARAIFVTANGLADKYRQAYPSLADRVHTIRNGYDGTPLPSISATGHRLKILFAGEIYVNRDPFGFLEALERLLSRPDVVASAIEVTFLGRCDAYRGCSIADWLRGKKAETVVRILPAVPMKDAVTMTQTATVMLNFAQRAKTMIPAKSYDQMASGREVLLLCEANSDTGSLFEGRKGVLRVDPALPEELDVALVDLYRRHVVEGQATVPAVGDVIEFSRAYQTTQYADLIERAIRARVAN